MLKKDFKMEDLKDIIKEIKTYKKELELNNLSDDNILRCATDIFNSQNIQEAKQGKKKGEPATDRQKFRLKKLGFDDENITKQEAFEIIKESKAKNKK